MNPTRIVAASVATGCAVALLLAACANDASTPYSEPDASTVVEAPSPSDADAMDASAEAEAGPCVDCEYFPTSCTGDVLCPNGPFASTTTGGALDPRTQINVVRGRSASDVWAVGALGAVAHFDGTSWTRSDLGASQTMLGLWLRGSSEEVVLGTLGKLYTRGLDVGDAGIDAGPPSSGGWTTHDGPVGPFDLLTILARFATAWGAEDGESLWCAMTAISPGFIEGIWRVRYSASTGKFELGGVVPQGTCNDLPCSQPMSIHGVSANDVWAVGLAGSIVRITNAESDTPTLRTFNSQTWNALRGVWMLSPTDGWAVGAQGTVRHYTGDPVLWDVVPNVPANVDLRAVWASSSSDVWAVGTGAVVLHFDGKAWTRVKVAGLDGRRPDLNTIWGSGPDHVWVGGQGVILSLEGKP